MTQSSKSNSAQPITREPIDEVISIVHTKGGAGKSSLTTNLAYALSCLSYRVLVIDLDRQTGQSIGFGIPAVATDSFGRPLDVGAVLRGEVELADAVVRDVYPGLDVLPAEEKSLVEAERMLTSQGIDGQIRLYEVLHGSSMRWDIVLIDTPGRQTEIVGVALAASSGVLIPAIPEGGPVAELSTILNHVLDAKQLIGQLEIYGIIRMRVGGNSRYRKLAEDQTKEIAAAFEVPVFRNKVPEDARFGESHLVREPIGAYSAAARSAVAYRCIADELITSRGWARFDGSTAMPARLTAKIANEPSVGKAPKVDPKVDPKDQPATVFAADVSGPVSAHNSAQNLGGTAAIANGSVAPVQSVDQLLAELLEAPTNPANTGKFALNG
jgi:chromosome partitioning protein